MVIDRIFVTNTTQMSLSDRFTILQSVRPSFPPQRLRAAPFSHNEGAALGRSKRLLDRLGMTPVVQAAMALQKIPLKQRIGKVGVRLTPHRPPHSQSLIRNGASLYPSGMDPMSPTKGLRRPRKTLKLSPLKRTNSYTSLRRPRPRSRSRTNSIGNLSRSNSLGNLSQFGDQMNSFSQNRGGRGRNSFRYRNRSRGARNGTGPRGRGFGGRWRGGRGRGRGRGRGWTRNTNNQPPPSKEELDRQLEQYMAGSRAHLDRELDSYMNTAMDIQ